MKPLNEFNTAGIGALIAALALSAFLLFPEAQAAPGGESGFIKSSSIRSAVKAYIEKNMPWERDNVHILFPMDAPDVVSPGGKTKYEVRAGRNEEYIGETVLKVLFFKDDALIREELVRVRIEVMLDVAVAVRAIERDAEIRKEDIKVAGRWFTRMPSNTVTDPADIVGKRAAVSIRPNCEISRSMVKNSILVARGRMVRIILENGPLRIVSMGLAEESGGRNDMIRVRNTSSQKTMYARVIDNSLVKVEF
jgi:flagella basal body P-ring formation protein FlgA